MRKNKGRIRWARLGFFRGKVIRAFITFLRGCYAGNPQPAERSLRLDEQKINGEIKQRTQLTCRTIHIVHHNPCFIYLLLFCPIPGFILLVDTDPAMMILRGGIFPLEGLGEGESW